MIVSFELLATLFSSWVKSPRNARGSGEEGGRYTNDLRYQLFCAKRGEIASSLLPPCRGCLFMHLIRAIYKAAR